jgi:serine/threonine protein kinase
MAHSNSTGNSDTMITRMCKAFPDHFQRDSTSSEGPPKKYHILRVLGSGATGIVLLARSTEDNTPYAVKVVDLEGMSEADKVRATAEVHCLLNCDFFSILKCHEDLTKRDPADDEKVLMIALVLDYANAGDLRQEIKSRARTGRAFREHEAGLLFLQVLMAVHHVHSRHMIHRDIKSANILLCSNGLVKLGDFGFSKMYAATVSDDVGKTFCGTPYYVAPEIWKRCPYSKKADMFSLGVLLYELLTLKRPFDGANMNDVMAKTLQGEYEPLPSSISPEMAHIVGSLLQGNPERRPNSSDLLNAPICKLFSSGLMEIVQTQPSFDGALRNLVTEQIQSTKASLNATKAYRPMEDTASDMATMTSVSAMLEGGQPLNVDASVVLHEGTVKKQSGDGAWKRRYLCIRAEPDAAGESPVARYRRFDLVLAVSKDSVAQQSIVTPFEELEDAFPVPSKYTGSNVSHVFAVAFKTGKRLSFQARNDDERNLWMDKIQQVLGIA